MISRCGSVITGRKMLSEAKALHSICQKATNACAYSGDVLWTNLLRQKMFSVAVSSDLVCAVMHVHESDSNFIGNLFLPTMSLASLNGIFVR